MIKHAKLTDTELFVLIRKGKIRLAGNRRLKIYGQLNCCSGKRMSRENRVFFASEDEAQLLGYRPCGNCMHDAYLRWKKG
jgi:methylphosphotriester-DNA--protein-cysteine methyltransferase